MQYTIRYRKGADNRAADALPRCPASDVDCVAVSTASPAWVQAIRDSYQHDSVAQGLLTKLAVDPSAVPSCTLQDGLLRYKGRLWVGNAPDLQQQLLAAVHTSPVGGHSGIPVTLWQAKQLFAWHGMKAPV